MGRRAEKIRSAQRPGKRQRARVKNFRGSAYLCGVGAGHVVVHAGRKKWHRAWNRANALIHQAGNLLNPKMGGEGNGQPIYPLPRHPLVYWERQPTKGEKMTEEKLNKMDIARHLLPPPGDEVAGELIQALRASEERVREATELLRHILVNEGNNLTCTNRQAVDDVLYKLLTLTEGRKE